jgi:putative intracellular protease/amidase
MDELAQAWAVFTDNGFAVDIASPAGGPVVADSYNAEKPYNARLLGDVVARQALESTLRLSDIRERSYTAIMVIGGKGAMFDLPTDAALKSLLLATYGRGGVIGAVCHGPAVFMNLQLADGTSLIRGRRITGFTNAEERLFGERWMPVFPVLLEDGLRGAGGEFSAGPMMLSHVVTDGRLVTGQNPYSTAATAEAMIRAMGLTPAARTPWQDERSMALITRAIAGELDWARSALAEQRDLYEVPLIAIWGYYRSQEPGLDQVARRQALSIMELAQPYFPEPQLAAAIAATRAELGQEARP